MPDFFMPLTAVKLYQFHRNTGCLHSLLGGLSTQVSLKLLAETISRDSRISSLCTVVRIHGEHSELDGLYLFGELSPGKAEAVRQLASQIQRADFAARYVDYHNAEKLAAKLAEKLINHFGRDGAADFEFRAVPRGGLIVCAMLLYALGLKESPSAVRPDGTVRTLVLVDDCLLSGMRIRQQLEKYPGRQVVVATLFAPRELCAEKTSETLPLRCICARELEDHAPELYGDSYAKWKSHWEERLKDKVLWIGQPEYLTFAWSEPESSFINAVSGELEPGFRLVPGSRCFRSSMEYSSGGNVQIQKDGRGEWTTPAGVISARLDDFRIAVADFSSDSGVSGTADCFLLEDTAADMWDALLQNPTFDHAAGALSSFYHADPAEIRADLYDFAGTLKAKGLLIHV